MTVLAIIFRLLGAATSVYMLLCIVRVFLYWFPTSGLGRSAEMLERVTDPYLSIWSRLSFLKAGGIDFSPIVALAVLSGVSRMFSVASYGALTVGLVLSLVLEIAWAPVAFLLGFFAVLLIARIIAYAAHWNSLHPVWRAVDAMINPVLFRIKRLIYRDRIVNYMQGLITGVLVIAGVRVALGLVVGLLIGLLRRI